MIIIKKNTNAQKDKENSKGNIIEDRQRMEVEEIQEGKQKTRKEIKAERKNQMINQESQSRKIGGSKKESRRQREQKERESREYAK